MRRVGIVIAAACALSLCACSGGRGPGEAGPPPFRVGVDPSPLAEPAAAPAGKDGLEYLKLVYPRLRDPWVSFVNDCRLRLPAEHELNRSGLRAVVELSIRADGALVASAVSSASGEAEFDKVALEMARDAGPYPAPPADVLSDDGLLHLAWAFHRDQRLAGLATVELQRIAWPPHKAIPSFLAAGAVESAVQRFAAEVGASGANATLTGLGEQLSAAVILRALDAEQQATQAIGVDAAARARLAAAGPQLENLSRNATDSVLRRKAIAALGAVGARGSKAQLLELVRGEVQVDDAAIVTAAMVALEQLGAGAQARVALRAQLAGTPRQQQLALTVAVSVALPEAIGRLAAMAGKGTRAVRSAACNALGLAVSASSEKSEKAAAHKILRKLLGAKDASVRAACARGAGRTASASRLTYWKLIALFKDRDERVRAEALRAASLLEPSRFSKELFVLRRERSPIVLAALAEALGRGGGAGAVERLVKLAGSEHVEIRRAAATALAARKQPAAGEFLATLIGDDDLEVRLTVLRAPVAIDITTFARLLESDNESLRFAALLKLYSGFERSETLVNFAERVAAASDDAGRARLAGAWLSR